MPFYKPNSNGNYLSHCNPHPAQEIIEDDNVSVILNNFNNNWNIRETRLKDLIDDVYHNLERTEGFHYGVSKEVCKLKGENGEIPTNKVIREHAVPATIVIEEIKRRVIVTGVIQSEEDLLGFLKEHYYMCYVTKKEDKKLNKKKMPNNWNDWDNWIARYKKAGIELDEKPTGQKD